MLDKKVRAVVALGYFDSVHLGHQKVIKSAKESANEKGCALVVFTFYDNLKSFLSGDNDKMVYTMFEREKLLKDYGVDYVYFAPVTKEFLSLDRLEFLQFIDSQYQVEGYVCGNDYRFGFKGAGDSKYLADFAKGLNRFCTVVDMQVNDGEKISSTQIKHLLSNGEIERANALLGRAYSVTGTVFADRKVGKKLGFPTVNVKMDRDKQQLKEGVYYGYTSFGGKRYKAIINYGARPTFDLDGKLIEAHILDFTGDLYGKDVTVEFLGFLRDIAKFNSTKELKDQLQKDLDSVRGIKYD